MVASNVEKKCGNCVFYDDNEKICKFLKFKPPSLPRDYACPNFAPK